MILQALTRYYQTLAGQGRIAAPGWGAGKIAFALVIDGTGGLVQVLSVLTQQQRGNKTVFAPREISGLPAPVKRSSGIAANFLWDNSGYLLGVDNKGKPRRSKECFEACRALHESILPRAGSPAAAALLAFFRNWKPEEALTHPALAEHLEEILSGVNLLFRYDGAFVHEDPAIRKAWEHRYNSAADGGPEMVCLVTGEKGPVEYVHPSIKNVQGAQSSGAALVSFNAPAFCSYGREQNLNAPTGKYAAFAYTAALNHILADWAHVCRMGDATVVFWAQCGATAYQDVFGGLFGGPNAQYGEQDLQGIVKELCKGHAVQFNAAMLDPEMKFYVLGLSPNAARLSVRFFLQNTFGGFLQNVEAHRARLIIERPAYEKFETPSLKAVLDSTVNQNTRDKQPSPELAGEMLRAILTGARYPATLLNGVTLRIRAEQRDKDRPDRPFKITWTRAAVLKAYYLKNTHKDVPEEVLTMALNEASTNVPYVLGRLFSVLEDLQQKANPGVNATITDKYFNSACATPAVVFPTLVKLSRSHLRKLDGGVRIFYEKKLGTIFGLLTEEYPARLTLPQQGAFQLGYYHQTQARYIKKEEKENV